MYDGFGAKTANVSAMRTFGFPDGTIPDGFGIPFYFYQEFMKYNGFFDEIELMVKDSAFISDITVRNAKLADLRSDIKIAGMPGWMSDQLSVMQNSFPAGTSIRCRSSTNNEDLPGFSGAGLYDSKTHHPDEGHISKTIKQVYASLWNLRAFEEREFNRVNQFYASMGVLCHPNYDNEKVNGVGVSADPFYKTENTFYSNSQLSEELITNPGSAFPEELLIRRFPDDGADYSVIQYSSLLNVDSLLMTDMQLDLLRQFLLTIHNRFAVLYNAENNSTFAIDIEYKIDASNQLVIKQARPWVSYVPEISQPFVPFIYNRDFVVFPNPADGIINIGCQNCGMVIVRITDLPGRIRFEKEFNLINLNTQIPIGHLSGGVYIVSAIMDRSISRSVKLIKQ